MKTRDKVLATSLIVGSIGLLVYLATLAPFYVIGGLGCLVLFGSVYSILDELF